MKLDFHPSKKLIRKYLIILISVLMIICCYYLLTVRNVGRYTGRHPLHPPMKCRNLTDVQMQQLVNFTYKIHEFLDKLGLKHWLMYGSLLGALRVKGPLIWDDDVDFGLDGNGRLSEISKTELFNKIKNSLDVKEIVDHWARDSQIPIYDKNSEFKADLVIFSKSGDTVMRRGWLTWLLYFQYKAYHSFPARLVENPLPKTQFRFFNISVPRDGKEILKYIYRDDWWKVVKPSGC